MSGSITAEDRAFMEEWEHVSPQRYGIIRFDARGDEKPEIISGQRSFKITTEERIVTQDRVRNAKLDPFLNGSFRPVIVPDSVTIESNPNALSDTEIHKILESSDLAWGEWLSTIDSVATLTRMVELSRGSDLTVRRFEALQDRLENVRGEVRIDTNDEHLKKFLTDRPTVEAPVRRRGGRSSDYRPSDYRPDGR